MGIFSVAFKDNFIIRLRYDPSHDYRVGILKLRELHLISVFVFMVSFLRDPRLQRRRVKQANKGVEVKKINQRCRPGVTNLYQILSSNSDHKHTARLSSASWTTVTLKRHDSEGAGAGTAFRMNFAKQEEYTRSSGD